MCGECLNAMARIGGQTVAAGLAAEPWEHYAECDRRARAMDDDLCICDDLEFAVAEEDFDDDI